MNKIASVLLCWTVLSWYCHVALFGDIWYGRDHVTQKTPSRTHLLPLLLFSPSLAAFWDHDAPQLNGQGQQGGSLEVSSSLTLEFLSSSLIFSGLLKRKTEKEVRTYSKALVLCIMPGLILEGRGWERVDAFDRKNSQFSVWYGGLFVCLFVCLFVISCFFWQRSVHATKDKNLSGKYMIICSFNQLNV